MKDCGHKMMMGEEMSDEMTYPQFSLSGEAASGLPKEGEFKADVVLRVVGTSTPTNGEPSVRLELVKIGETEPTSEADDTGEDADEGETETESPASNTLRKSMERIMSMRKA
jgi:hypothetical protein